MKFVSFNMSILGCNIILIDVSVKKKKKLKATALVGQRDVILIFQNG